MDCERARAGLWPPEQPKLVGEEVAAARAHVDACPSCASYFAQDRALLDLYDRARRQPAPARVRERVFDALSRARWTRSERRTRRTGRLAAAAGVVLFAVTIVTLQLRLGTAAPRAAATQMFVEDYLRRAVGEDHIDTDDAEEVQRFLQRELGVRLMPLQPDGLVLARVEICLLDGRRGAMIVYRRDGAEVSHYIVPRADAHPRPPELSSYPASSGGDEMPIVTWATPRLEHALVGSIAESRLLEIARTATHD